MKKFLAYLSMACGVMAFSATANAVPMQWTVSETTFDDGGTVTGSFVYDADTNIYSNIRLRTTAGTEGSAAEFRTQCTTAYCLASLPELLFIASSNQANLSNVPLLDIEPSAPLTNTPETVDLAFGMSFLCSNAECTGIGTGLRVAFSGKLTGALYIAPVTPTSVPTSSPIGLGLMALLLATAAWMYRRRRSGY
ncbi:IPTL-CTERM sorting domain-containing protein [Comamonas piscis]|uniref:IPTL-CTERM sorting domain-containing protein n=1 Tax=Comamonas piscis TaxID=1562974 RepID=A0A7G5EKC8_9BURK|nr:IPTL-CTERM sorting domain-containing protein [Comamonas piscis]QMV74453.1 IPTL-CTERM sorting domain-containing protein [Comamonas piscis]WSO32908.1 IPTL-CTERM sorting domain-containing protein [Comamonas piscis]